MQRHNQCVVIISAILHREYLRNLLTYLETFHERTNPLGSLTKVYSKLEQDFDNSFEEGQVPGWEDRGAGRLPGAQENAIDLQAFDTVEELESLGKMCILPDWMQLFKCHDKLTLSRLAHLVGCNQVFGNNVGWCWTVTSATCVVYHNISHVQQHVSERQV